MVVWPNIGILKPGSSEVIDESLHFDFPTKLIEQGRLCLFHHYSSWLCLDGRLMRVLLLRFGFRVVEGHDDLVENLSALISWSIFNVYIFYA